MKKIGLAMSIAATLTTATLYAEEQALNPIVVSGKRSSLLEQNGQVFEVRSNDLSTKQPEHLSDVLRGTPGVDIGGTTSINQRIFIRGVPDTALTITLDGARQGGHHFHHSGDLTIDASLLKKVDVAVGNNSVRNPSGSLGGAVRFTTVDASDLLLDAETFGGKVRLGYASNNKRSAGSLALFGRAGEQFEWLGSVSASDHDYGKDGLGEKIGGDGDVRSALLKGKWHITPEHAVDASMQYYQDEGFYPNRSDFRLTDKNPATQQELTRQTYSIGYAWQPTNMPLELRANVYQNTVEQSREYHAGESRAKTDGFTLDVVQELATASVDHHLAYGLDLYRMHNELDIKSPLFGGRLKPVYSKESLTSFAAYVEDAIHVGDFTITPGLRFDRYDGSKISYSQKRYNHLSKALGLHWQVTDNIGIFANYTELFRGPPAQEILVSQNTPIIFNQDLDAETGKNYEVGVNVAQNGLFHADDGLHAEIKLFRTYFDNLINAQYRGGPHGGSAKEFVNAGEVTLKGVEAAIVYRLNPVDARLTYSHAKSENAQGESLDRDTGDRYGVSLRYQSDGQPWSAGWDSQFVTSHTTNSFLGVYRQPGYGVSNVFVRYDVPNGAFKGLSAELGAYNLFDKYYVSQTSRNLNAAFADAESGRNIRFNLTYRF